MMPAPTSIGPGARHPDWHLMVLPPNRVSLDRIAKVKVRDGAITHAYAIEREPSRPFAPIRRLHWAEGVGSWEEGE